MTKAELKEIMEKEAASYIRYDQQVKALGDIKQTLESARFEAKKRYAKAETELIKMKG